MHAPIAGRRTDKAVRALLRNHDGKLVLDGALDRASDRELVVDTLVQSRDRACSWRVQGISQARS